MSAFDTVIRGGRVIDPETGLDAVRDVGIERGCVGAVSEEPLEGRTIVEASGKVVLPGFVDLHSHAQSLAGRRLQACDGVTTAFDLEAGRSPVAASYDRESDGSPINFGFSASWALARHRVLGGGAPRHLADALGVLGEREWRGTLSARQLGELLDLLGRDLADGAIGIGFLLGYAPEVPPEEYLAVSALAASRGVPTFTHCRELVEVAPHGLADGAEEIVRAAAETGGLVHYCHVNSSATRHVDRVLDLVDRCRREGGRVTTEAYPYGYASTVIGAAFLSAEGLRARKLAPSSLTYLPTSERVADEVRLDQLRREDPAGLVILDFLDEADPTERSVLLGTLARPDVIVASDAMPLVSIRDGFRDDTWPLPPRAAVTHPRTAGCFSRMLRMAREEGWPLAEVVRRCTLMPAQLLEGSCAAMRGKGRVKVGCDADLVVLDPATVSDEASREDTTRVSSGISEVLVAGVRVVAEGQLVPQARPGRPVRAG
ncbi:MAG TPA: amidohydrolase family protein [Acidimicrobiales bacterium]|nr:amidohydrolase family protein [Acidimicrobiales bacterium]